MPVKTEVKTKRTAAAREKKKEQETTAFINTIWVFCSVIVFEIFLIIGYEQYLKNSHYALTYQYILNYGKYVFLLLAAASAVMAVIKSKKHEKSTLYIRLAALFTVCCLLFVFMGLSSGDTAKVLCIAVPIAGLLLFVLFTYQREFFLECVICAVTIFAMLTVRKKYDITNDKLVVSVITIALSVIFAALGYWASRNKGSIKLFGKQLTIFDTKTAVYQTLYIACAISLVSAVCGMIFGAAFANSAICILAAFLFIAAVFHTVKLM